MGYGLADKIARSTAGPSAQPGTPLSPGWYARPELRAGLTTRDIGALYRVLKDDAGLSQRRIAQLTGQSSRRWRRSSPAAG